MGLRLVELTLDIEDHFEISLLDDVVSRCETVGQTRDAIVQILIDKKNATPDGLDHRVWQELMSLLTRNRYDTSKITPSTRWFPDIAPNG